MKYKAIKKKCSGMDDHLDICCVFEISKFDIARLTCIFEWPFYTCFIVYKVILQKSMGSYVVVLVLSFIHFQILCMLASEGSCDTKL